MEMLDEMYEYLKPGGRILIVEFNGHGHSHKHEEDHKEEKPTDGSSELCTYRQHETRPAKHKLADRKEKEEFIEEHIHFSKSDCIEDFVGNGFIYSGEVLPGELDLAYALVFEKVKFT